MIFYDPSEGRSTSALPQKIKDVGFTLPGLELRTGADLLITPLEDEWLVGKNVNKPPASLRFLSYLDSAMLIQRKTGSDMMQSIPHLDDQQQRMTATQDAVTEAGLNTPSVWLLQIGLYEPIMINDLETAKRLGAPESAVGRVLTRRDGIHLENFTWQAYRGCEDAWELRGGNIAREPWNDTAVDWLLRWNKNIHRMKAEHVVVRHQGMSRNADPRIGMLMALPGCGLKTAEALLAEFGSVRDVLSWVIDDGTGVKGVGGKKVESWRTVLGK